jgi:hypothetical protein
MKAAYIGFLVILIASIYGWINNIILLFSSADMTLASITLMSVLRIVGIFVPPLGAILGYL